MTVKEASEIYYINKEIERIQMDLIDLEQARTFYKPINLTGMPKGNAEAAGDKYLEEKELLEDELNYALRKLQFERRKFEKFLEEIEDAEVRLIVRLRCVNNMRWEQIGQEIGMDRRTASRKFYKCFNMPTMPDETMLN